MNINRYVTIKKYKGGKMALYSSKKRLYCSNLNANACTHLILFNEKIFYDSILNFLVCFDKKKYQCYTYNIIKYLYIYYCYKYWTPQILNNIKTLNITKNIDLYYCINYIHNIIKFYIKNPNIYWNLPFFINIVYNFLITFINNNQYPFLFNITFVQITALGIWSCLTSVIMYNKYKIYKENRKSFNKFFFWNEFYNSIKWAEIYKYMKYSKYGDYKNYKKVKVFMYLCKSLNKKNILIYNAKLKKFMYIYNEYYEFLLNDKKEQEALAKIKKYKIFKNWDPNFNYKQEKLYRLFLKDELKDYTPFFNTNIPIPLLNITDKNYNKKKLYEFFEIFIFENISHQLKWNYKKSSLSHLTKEELLDNYYNFYKEKIIKNKQKSALNLNLPKELITPSKWHKMFSNKADYDKFFENMLNSKDGETYSLDSLLKIIIKSLKSILHSTYYVCENSTDNKNIDFAPSQEVFDILNKNNVENNLLIFLNRKVSEDKGFLNFLNKLESFLNNKKDVVINPDIFDIPYDESKILGADKVINLFIQNNLFYLDYFNILINDNCYSLFYLISLYKVQKVKLEFEHYMEFDCKRKLEEYTTHMHYYNSGVNKMIKYLDVISRYNLKYRLNFYLFNENKNMPYNNFLFSLRNKKINFRVLCKNTSCNYKKINFKNDYSNLSFSWNNFVTHFNTYLDLNFKVSDNMLKGPPSKYYVSDTFNEFNNINKVKNKEGKLELPFSFEEFFYSSYDFIDNNNLQKDIEQDRSFILKFLPFYKFNDNETVYSAILNNFHDVGFYLYDIPGFEYTYKDTNFFFLLKEEYPLFNFAKDTINECKYDLLYASKLYFHYVLKHLKNLKTYITCIPHEHLIFDKSEFYYDNFNEYSTLGCRDDFLVFLNNFIPVLKTLSYQKDKHVLKALEIFSIHLSHLEDNLEKFPLHYIFNENELIENDLIKLDQDFSYIYEIWQNILTFINELRLEYVNYINTLRYDKINEFLEYPMFQKSISFLLLKKKTFVLLKQLIVEERLFDHISNIAAFYLRIYERPYNILRKNLLTKGILPSVNYLEVKDFDYIFSIEKYNPFIFIKLFNSKQRYLNSELWEPSITFEIILQSIINIPDRILIDDIEGGDEELQGFYNEYKNRDLILYDLTEFNILELKELLEHRNLLFFSQIDNVDIEIANFLNKNNYIKCGNSYKKNININIKFADSEDVNYNSKKKIKEKRSLIIEDNVSEGEIEWLENEKNKKKKEFYKSVINNTFFDVYNFTIYNEMWDHTNLLLNFNLDQLAIYNDDIMADFNNKITKFSRSPFRNYLLDLFYICNKDYKNFFNKIIKKQEEFDDLGKSLNYLHYLINSYELITNLDNINNSNLEFNLDNIQRDILNESYDILQEVNCKKNQIFKYTPLIFKSLIKQQILTTWKLNKSYNNKNFLNQNSLYSHLNGIYYLDYVKTFLIKDNQLPNLHHYIFELNLKKKDDNMSRWLQHAKYKHTNNNFYNASDLILYDTLNTVGTFFQYLNIKILKLNYMLKTLIDFQRLLTTLYLPNCKQNINNIEILKILIPQLQLGNKKENSMFIDLINILLYVKDPIYFFNILNIDIKLYLNVLLDVYNILQKTDPKDNFNIFLWNKENDTFCYNYKLTLIYSLDQINELNNLIYWLNTYEGFFNFDIINDNDNNNNKSLLEKFNFPNLLKDLWKLNLFTINNVNDLKVYDYNKLIEYFYFNNISQIENYIDLLAYLNINNENNKLYGKSYINNENNNLYKNNQQSINETKIHDAKIKEFLVFYDKYKNNKKIFEEEINKDKKLKKRVSCYSFFYPSSSFYFDNKKNFEEEINKNKKLKKSVSCYSSFYLRQKKIKKIHKKKQRLWFNREGYNVYKDEHIIADDYFSSSYEDLVITEDEEGEGDDEEGEGDDEEGEGDDEEGDDEDEILKAKKQEDADKRVLHQSNFITILFRQLRQWNSDLDFHEAYRQCKTNFDKVFNDMTHPIWKDLKPFFPNEKLFIKYINKLNNLERKQMFENYWAYTIELIVEERNKITKKKEEDRWLKIIKWSQSNKKVTPFNLEELCEEFNLKIDKGENWKKLWSENNYYLFPKKKEGNYITEQKWEDFYGTEDRGQKIEPNPNKLIKNKKFKLFDKNNWWKLF